MLLPENYLLVRQSLEIVGLSVFHTLWAGGLLLLLLMVVLRVMPTQLAKARFAVSLVALQLLFLLFLGIFFYQCHQLSPAAELVDKTAAAPVPTVSTVLPSLSTVAKVNAPPVPVPWFTRLQQWSRWWAALWLLGVAYHALQLLLGVRHTRQLKAYAQPVSGDWEGRFGCLKQRLGIKRPVRFLRSDQTAVPLTFGWLKPVVLIPASLLTQLSPEQLEMIVLHELAHIRRHDYFWSLGQSVAEVVLFYHPAYWYIARVLEREREFACDQTTVSLTQQPHTYARTLLQVATTVAPNYGLAVSGKRGLSDRIKRIINPALSQGNGPVLPALILIGVLGIASATFAMQRHPFGSGDGPKAQEQLADSTDVDYGPSFEEVMAQVTDETLDTTSLTLDEIYANAITIDQDLNRMDSSIADYIAAHSEIQEEFPPYSPINYSSPEVLYVVDGRVRNPKSIRKSEVDKISVFTEPEKADINIKGVDISNYSTIVKASTKKGKHTSSESQASDLAGRQLYLRNGWGQITPQVSSSKSYNTTDQPDRWLYVVNDQVQTNRPTFLDGNYQADGWETRYVPVERGKLKDYLKEGQRVAVDASQYTGIVFITHKDYQPKHVVYGTVVKREKGYLVPDVTVRVKGKNISTTTNAYGDYRLVVSHRLDTIEFLFNEGVIEEVPVDGRQEINLTTPVDRALIEEMKTKKMQEMLRRTEQKLQSTIQTLQTQPAQDSTTTNTLIIIDGIPQYGKSWSEIDQTLKENSLYSHYTLTSHEADSSRAILKALRADKYDRVVSIDSWANLEKGGQIAPSKLEELLQVFPNPTQDWFTLQFSIGEELPVTLIILNNQGQSLTTLTDQTYPAGAHEVAWDASDRKPGVYFVQWTVGEQRVTRKVVIE